MTASSPKARVESDRHRRCAAVALCAFIPAIVRVWWCRSDRIVSDAARQRPTTFMRRLPWDTPTCRICSASTLLSDSAATVVARTVIKRGGWGLESKASSAALMPPCFRDQASATFSYDSRHQKSQTRRFYERLLHGVRSPHPLSPRPNWSAPPFS
jgi:hypothetical protein